VEMDSRKGRSREVIHLHWECHLLLLCNVSRIHEITAQLCETLVYMVKSDEMDGISVLAQSMTTLILLHFDLYEYSTIRVMLALK
jgi:hypothetical protein